MNLLKISPLIFIYFALLLQSCSSSNTGSEKASDQKDSVPSFSYIKVNGTQFELNGKPYYYLGTNFWQGMNLASKGKGGDRERLLRELDKMKELGITNLRIIAGSEGPETEPYRIIPAVQTKPGVYNEELLDGLDFLLAEMRKRKMYAVVVLNNFWHWSGGMGQYIVWTGEADSIPYPPPHPNGTWDGYMKFVSSFYSNEKAIQHYKDFIKMIVTRKNSYTGNLYKDEPAIMSWQLANEPRGMNNTEKFQAWLNNTASYIKSLDKNHLVTTGSEGETPYADAGMNFIKDHSGKNIDYATFHIWAQNWSWFDPLKPSTFEPAKNKMLAYLKDHVQKADSINKPVVLEEFGLARDKGSFDPFTTTIDKDKYYKAVFDSVYQLASNGKPIAGVNFWAWGGNAYPAKPYGSLWKEGDPFIGDPPHEQQGWYSVYTSDTSTVKLISEYAQKMNQLKN